MRPRWLIVSLALAGLCCGGLAEAPTSRTIGTQRVLVVRVDCSDFPGASISAGDMQAMMDDFVKPFFEENSYGLDTLSSTVTSQVYRLPRTGASYALAGDHTALHADARALANSDYPAGNYDRFIVVMPDLGPRSVPGSRFSTWGGLASGAYIWIQANPVPWDLVAHELGHTHGLPHANSWNVADGNPLSAGGRSLEGGDHYDLMGSPAPGSPANDPRRHFNQRFKNQLGWLADSAVATITASGTYRVYRFDHKDALASNRPLALRIFRDGTRWYWLGYRCMFLNSSAATQASGLSVLWGLGSGQPTQMIDLSTAGSKVYDSTLAIGATLSDPDYGITIRPVGRGGSEPAQFIDVEIVLNDSATPPNTIAVWGGGTATLNVPSGLTNTVAIATGQNHALALRADGSLVAWGDNTEGQTTIPPNAATDIVAVAAGGNASGVVKRNGTVYLWGTAQSGVTAPPFDLTGVKQLAIGGNPASFYGLYHALALKSDGTVVAWGDNSRGQSRVPVGLANVVSIAAANLQSIALKADGTIVRWGVTWAGSTPPPSGGGFVAIASHAAAGHALALKADGTVAAWGVNSSQVSVPVGLDNVVAVACGHDHSLALRVDGSIVAWGANGSGQTNIPPSLPRAYGLAGSGSNSYALVGSLISITTQPQSQAVALGGSAILNVEATGSGSFAYQWRRNGVFVPGATASTLRIEKFTPADAGIYDVVVKFANGFAPTLSTPATIGVSANPARLINLSILSPLAVSEAMTVGVVLGGGGTSGTKPLLMRAAGPSLALFGLTSVLPDPVLALSNVSASPPVAVALNYDWGGAAALSTAFTSVGAFPFASVDSKDAALYRGDLTRGSYTVQINDSSGGTGTVLAELYEATPSAAFTSTTPRLINVSLLRQIAAGRSITTGFVVGGSGTIKVLIRAVGPTLGMTPFAIPGTLADPKLEIFNNATGTKINENNDWSRPVAPLTSTHAQLTAAFTAVGAFQLAGPNTKDAALLVTLGPGQYSARISDADGGGGVAIVEIYEVP